MLSFIKHLAEKWNNWCGDRDMEMSIRTHLSQNGYFGGMAELKNVRLVAVQRPGWQQVFRFEAVCRVDHQANGNNDDNGPDLEPEYHQLYGLVRDDIRHKVNIVRVFRSEKERRELFVQWSDGLICLRGAHGLSATN